MEITKNNKIEKKPTLPKIELFFNIRKNDRDNKDFLESISEFITCFEGNSNIAILKDNLLPYNHKNQCLKIGLAVKKTQENNTIFCQKNGEKLNESFNQNKEYLFLNKNNIIKIKFSKNTNILTIFKIAIRERNDRSLLIYKIEKRRIFSGHVTKIPSYFESYAEAIKYLLEKIEGKHQNEFFAKTPKDRSVEKVSTKEKSVEDVMNMTDEKRTEENREILKLFSQ